MSKLGEVLKEDPVDPRDAIKAASWLSRNLPRVWRWIQYFRGKTGILLVCVLAISSTAGTCVKAVANLPDLPEPPKRTPAVSVTPTPTPEAR